MTRKQIFKFPLGNNKKAQTGHTVVKTITWVIFLIIVMLMVVYLVRNYVKVKFDTKEIEAELVLNELILTNNGIIYKDNTISRYYPGIIDLNDFNQDTIDQIISYGPKNSFLAANISLTYLNNTIIKSIIYNEEWYTKAQRWGI